MAADARAVFVNQVKGDSLAEMMLESAFNLTGGEGEFAILSSTPTATNQNAWIDFMKAKMAAEPKFFQLKLGQIAYGEESEQINQQQALALVQAFPDLKVIIVPAGDWPARRCSGTRGGGPERQGQAHRSRACHSDLEIYQRRRGPGYLVERHRSRLSHLSGRPSPRAM